MSTSVLTPARRAGVLGAAILIAAALAPGAAVAVDTEIERLRAENERLRTRVETLEAENARLRGGTNAALAAAIEQQAGEKVFVEPATRDRGASVITAPSRIEPTGPSRSRHWITLRSAPRQGEPAEVELVIASSASDGIYRDAKTLELVADGRRFECPVVGYRTEPITVARSVGKVGEKETVVAVVAPGALAAVADAQEVIGTLGPLRFRLTPEQLATARAFRKRLDS